MSDVLGYMNDSWFGQGLCAGYTELYGIPTISHELPKSTKGTDK